MITQTLALFLDAYRELNSRKLFWITMVLSGVVVLVYAAFGLNERGLSFLWWQFDTPMLTSRVLPPEKFYLWTFVAFGAPIWLTWVQTILALVSTASIFPDFVAGGSIELVLCRPISRMRLFLTKYATGLLFVALQVLVFSLACFLVIGIRGKSWEPGIFLAVPIVVVFFSYLFAICALLGLLTRSSIAALLLTIVVWFGLFLVNTTDGVLLKLKIEAQLKAERQQTRIDRMSEPAEAELTELEELNESAAGWENWSRFITLARTVLPKTADTIDLLNTYLITQEESDVIMSAMVQGQEQGIDREVLRRIEEETRNRGPAWAIGTSLLFEVAVLGVAVWVFSRKDF